MAQVTLVVGTPSPLRNMASPREVFIKLQEQYEFSEEAMNHLIGVRHGGLGPSTLTRVQASTMAMRSPFW